MIKSESIKELLTALAKAQGKISAAKKDSTNPHFKSKYSDLASCWDAIREPLSSNGLSLSQWVSTSEKGINLITMLGHSSGEWISSEANFPVKDPSNPQAVGSSISYARRYCLSAAISLVSDDDDGNAGAQDRATPERQITRAPTTLPKPALINNTQIVDLISQAATLNVSEAQLIASNQGKPLEEWDVPAYAKAKAQLHAKETNLRIAKEQAELAKG
jgi:hypothetical protein